MVVPLDAVWVHGTYGHIVYRSNPVSRSRVTIPRRKSYDVESNLLSLTCYSHNSKQEIIRFQVKAHTIVRERSDDSVKRAIQV